VLAGVFGLALAHGPDASSLPNVKPNDNRHPAGRIRHDTVRVTLAVRMATWKPEGDAGPAIAVPAFAEEGKAPQVPGPLLRTAAGTVIDATVRNDLSDSTITVRGLATRPATGADSLVIAPGESSRIVFPAGAPGTYLYYAEVGRQDTLMEREQLAGALVVDSAGASPGDRVFVINIWGEPVDAVHRRNALAINGRSFPYDERIEARVGDTLRWRLVNASLRPHPMHLHGFYFDVYARGNGLADTIFSPADRRMVVTEGLLPRSTASIVWSPDRPGNWLFHCHLMFHALGDARLGVLKEHGHEREHDLGRHMAGLVLGISVAARGLKKQPRGTARRLRLFAQEGARHGRAPRAMGFVLQHGDAAPAPDSVEVPGTVLTLTRGEPTDVTVINRLDEPTAVHWHGLELESYSDGVAWWSGYGNRVAPEIQPGDSFIAHLTLRRAGTFIYHTHLNDLEQLTSGMYGALVALEPGHAFDPATDHVYVAGWDGDEDPPHIVINGDSVGPPLDLAAGVVHRFRLVNIGMAALVRFSLSSDSGLVIWRRVARDGADLPPQQSRLGPAAIVLAVGQTADATFLPPGPGRYRLTAQRPGLPAFWEQTVTVR